MQSRVTVPYVTNAAVLFPASTLLHSEPQIISQHELSLLLSLRGRLKQLEAQIATEEQSLKTRLEAGAQIQPGDHRAELRESLRRNVSWKDVTCRLAQRLGYDPDAYTSSVLTHTKPTRTLSLIID